MVRFKKSVLLHLNFVGSKSESVLARN